MKLPDSLIALDIFSHKKVLYDKKSFQKPLEFDASALLPCENLIYWKYKGNKHFATDETDSACREQEWDGFFKAK